MVANLGGLSDPGGAEGASSAALLLFGVFLVVPTLGLVSGGRPRDAGTRRLPLRPPEG